MNLHRILVATLAFAAAISSATSGQAVVDLIPTKDNTLFQSATGTLSEGAGVAIFCGVTNMNKKRRALIRFDVASSIPAGATILGATLTLEMNQTAGGPLNIDLRVMTADWGEGTSAPATGNGGQGSPATTNDATWLHSFYPSTLWATPGGDFSPAASATTSVWQYGFYTWSSAQTTTDVQNWLDNPATDFGWMLKSPETLVGDAKRFGSREDVLPSSWPRLTVTYVAPPSASVTDLGLGCSGIQLAAIGLPRLGNSSFALDLTGAPAGAVSFVLVSGGLAPAPLDLGAGCFFDLEIVSAIGNFNAGIYLGPVLADNLGHAAFPAPIPPQAWLHGASIDVQCVTFGPTIGSSNVLMLLLGS